MTAISRFFKSLLLLELLAIGDRFEAQIAAEKRQDAAYR